MHFAKCAQKLLQIVAKRRHRTDILRHSTNSKRSSVCLQTDKQIDQTTAEPFCHLSNC